MKRQGEGYSRKLSELLAGHSAVSTRIVSVCQALHRDLGFTHPVRRGHCSDKHLCGWSTQAWRGFRAREPSEKGARQLSH